MVALETYEFHEFCLNFPEAPEDVVAEMADDIKAHGLVEPIWVHEGKIIDGRNRLKACGIAGVEPRFQEWDGVGSLADFVLSKNLHRRHLTASQRAMIVRAFRPAIAAEIKEETKRKQAEGGKSAGRGRPKDDDQQVSSNSRQDLSPPRDTNKELAAKAKTSRAYVADAEKIAKASPEAAEAVKRGEKTIPEAKRELGLDRPKPSSNGHAGGKSKVNGQVIDDPPDIAKARSEGRIPADVVVEVHEPEASTAVADVAEDIAEREAMGDDALSDEDWLRSLPLSGQLDGTPLKIFRADAIAYRRLEGPRRSYKSHANRAFKAVRDGRGAFIWRARSFLGIDHPSKWVRCAPVDKGGCGGSGHVRLIGACPECKGRGYRING